MIVLCIQHFFPKFIWWRRCLSLGSEVLVRCSSLSKKKFKKMKNEKKLNLRDHSMHHLCILPVKKNWFKGLSRICIVFFFCSPQFSHKIHNISHKPFPSSSPRFWFKTRGKRMSFLNWIQIFFFFKVKNLLFSIVLWKCWSLFVGTTRNIIIDNHTWMKLRREIKIVRR